MNLDAMQQQAFDAACEIVDCERANALRKLKHWNSGGCLNRGSVKPEIPDETPEEDAAIRALWLTLPGSSCWMSALYMLSNQSPSLKETKS